MRNIEADGFLDRPNIYKNAPSLTTLAGLYYSCWDKDIDRARGLAVKKEYTDQEISTILETPMKEFEERYEPIFDIGDITGKETFDPLTLYISGIIRLAKMNRISVNEVTSFLEEQIFRLTNLQKDNPKHKKIIAKAYKAIGDAYYEARESFPNTRYQKMYEKTKNN